MGFMFHWQFWIQPVFYAFHGWLATEMALLMLFRPYQAHYWPGTRYKIPFTPGIFPRGQHKLAVSVADTITQILLTQEDMLAQLKLTLNEETLSRWGQYILTALFPKEKGGLLQLKKWLREIEMASLEKILPNLQQWVQPLIPNMAEGLMNTALSPDALRLVLIQLLTDQTIKDIVQQVQKRSGGLQGLVLRFVDIEKWLLQFRIHLSDHPEDACTWIQNLSAEIHLKERLMDRMQRFSQDRSIQWQLQAALSQNHWISKTLLGYIRQGLSHPNPPWRQTLLDWLHIQAPRFMPQILESFQLKQLIIDKINRFSSQQLETMIQQICHRELRWLAVLGTIIGFWLGLASNVINLFITSCHP